MATTQGGRHSQTEVHARPPKNIRIAYYTHGAIPGFENNGIRYLNAHILLRPLNLPFIARVVTIVALVIAAIIGIVIIYWYWDNIATYESKTESIVQENINRDSPLNMPDVMALATLNDEDMMASITATGENFYVRSAPGENPNGGFEIIKLPNDVSVEEAEEMYATGLKNLSATDASMLLNGSWDLTVDRESGMSLYVWFADFTATSTESAVQDGLNNSGLSTQVIEDSGIDLSGNTYASGTYTTEDEQSYTWRVSALPLTDMYNISGLPSNSYFVGVRLTTYY